METKSTAFGMSWSTPTAPLLETASIRQLDSAQAWARIMSTGTAVVPGGLGEDRLEVQPLGGHQRGGRGRSGAAAAAGALPAAQRLRTPRPSTAQYVGGRRSAAAVAGAELAASVGAATDRRTGLGAVRPAHGPAARPACTAEQRQDEQYLPAANCAREPA